MDWIEGGRRERGDDEGFVRKERRVLLMEGMVEGFVKREGERCDSRRGWERGSVFTPIED